VDHGHVFYKLFLRAFPNHFKPDSVYAHYPMVVPLENKKILESLGTADDYSWDRPARIPPMTFITSHAAAKVILGNKIDYRVTWGEAISFLSRVGDKDYGKNYCLAGDLPVNLQSREMMGKAIYPGDWKQHVKAFYEDITLDLLYRNSYKIAGVSQVDIVRDVSNLAHTHLCANIFSLPLKTKSNPLGIYSEQELYLVIAAVFTCIFFDADPAKSFPLRQAARKVAQQLGQLTLFNVEAVSRTGFFATIVDSLHRHSALSDYGVHMIQRCLEGGLDTKTTVYQQILPTAGGMVANQGQIFAQCLDYYLSPEGKEHLPEIKRLAELDTPEADEILLHYLMEGSRMKASVGLYRDVTKAATIDDNGTKVNLEPGQRIMVDLVTASMDPKAFPNPDKVVLDRDLDTYIHYGFGPHKCLGYELSMLGLTTMLKTIGKLNNLRRAPGPQGDSGKILLPGGYSMYTMIDQSSYFPFPTSMKIQWDGDLPSRTTR
jgi:linoleate 8R-lipoxygenase / 9,12-octadecadienoate 8-hydroperoxide 8R-isomerase